MVDVITIIAVVVSVVTSVASLAYWLGRKFTEIELRLSSLDDRIKKNEDRLTSLEDRIKRIEDRLASLENRVSRLEERLARLEDKVNRLEERISRLENAFIQFSDILITTFESKNILTSTEALSLRSVVKALLPIPKTKYYTWEVYEKLKQLLDKDPNDYTMADIEQMNDIADLIEKEGMETNRRDLIEYAWKLRYYAMIARAVFIYPKLRQQK